MDFSLTILLGILVPLSSVSGQLIDERGKLVLPPLLPFLPGIEETIELLRRHGRDIHVDDDLITVNLRCSHRWLFNFSGLNRIDFFFTLFCVVIKKCESFLLSRYKSPSHPQIPKSYLRYRKNRV